MRKALINHEGARIAKDGEDWNETRMTNVEGFSVLFQDGKTVTQPVTFFLFFSTRSSLHLFQLAVLPKRPELCHMPE